MNKTQKWYLKIITTAGVMIALALIVSYGIALKITPIEVNGSPDETITLFVGEFHTSNYKSNYRYYYSGMRQVGQGTITIYVSIGYDGGSVQLFVYRNSYLYIGKDGYQVTKLNENFIVLERQ